MFYCLSFDKLRADMPDGVSIYRHIGKERLRINSKIMNPNTQILYLLQDDLWDKKTLKVIWDTIFVEENLIGLVKKYVTNNTIGVKNPINSKDLFFFHISISINISLYPFYL